MHTTPTTWPILDAAHTALRETVTTVRTDQWDGPTPCSGGTGAQGLRHAGGAQQACAAVLGEGDFPASDPCSPPGTLETSAPDRLHPPLPASRHAFSRV